MHALVHILSNNELKPNDIEEIMDPFYEGNIYPDANDDEEDVLIVYPEFSWDYYTLLDEPYRGEGIGDCFILNDPEKRVIARKHWNGIAWIKQTDAFESHVARNRERWKDCHMYELDIHW